MPNDSPSERRWLYIELKDLALGADFSSPAARAEAVAHVYERFTPFADDGWEWTTHPADEGFDGWIAWERHGRRVLVGAELLCQRSRFRAGTWIDPSHHLSERRLRQLVQRDFEPGPPPSRNKAYERLASGEVREDGQEQEETKPTPRSGRRAPSP